MYFVNWQRNISVEEQAGRKVVVKHSKPAGRFNEFILASTYALISLLLIHPSAPPALSGLATNEGPQNRERLKKMGIPTPALVSASQDVLVEEYVKGGDLYRALAMRKADSGLAFYAGSQTGRLHRAGLVFTDNKAQNYLVGDDQLQQRLVRTDLAFMQKSSTMFSRSMDIGSFLASVMDLDQYAAIERAFYNGYRSEGWPGFPYLSVTVRNILSVGFTSDVRKTLRNMIVVDSSGTLDGNSNSNNNCYRFFPAR